MQIKLTLRAHTVFFNFEKMQVISLYWFAANSSTTLRRRNFGWFYVKLSVESNDLGLFSKNNRHWPKNSQN